MTAWTCVSFFVMSLLGSVISVNPENVSASAEPAVVESVIRRVAAESPYGIDDRIPWTVSRIAGSPDPPSPYMVKRVFPNLKFNNPIELTRATGIDRFFVAELDGKIYSFIDQSDSSELDLFLDMAQEINGMKQVYGLTFHPDFQRNRYCSICYVLDPELPDGTRVSRFAVTKTDPPRVDPTSEKILITWLSGGHNGGCLQFGPDGLRTGGHLGHGSGQDLIGA